HRAGACHQLSGPAFAAKIRLEKLRCQTLISQMAEALMSREYANRLPNIALAESSFSLQPVPGGCWGKRGAALAYQKPCAAEGGRQADRHRLRHGSNPAMSSGGRVHRV